jgi:uncharacterized protein YaaR (DUF327 family)
MFCKYEVLSANLTATRKKRIERIVRGIKDKAEELYQSKTMKNTTKQKWIMKDLRTPSESQTYKSWV